MNLPVPLKQKLWKKTMLNKAEFNEYRYDSKNVKMVWATPDADNMIARIARVSNPANQANPSITGLLKYMMRENHVSPFEMVNVCLEINTTRDIGRQILRHRSFQFQEFSQRYASTDALPNAATRECRLQDDKNRQNSLPCTDSETNIWWETTQHMQAIASQILYLQALEKGIAKEQARALLPEGMTTSRLYMNGNLRSWIHYLQVRLHDSTQKEHRDIATEVLMTLKTVAPITMETFFNANQ